MGNFKNKNEQEFFENSQPWDGLLVCTMRSGYKIPEICNLNETYLAQVLSSVWSWFENLRWI